MPEGYYTSYGFYGSVDGEYMLFATEEEYFEYLRERNSDGESN